jgi:hypothetical protein
MIWPEGMVSGWPALLWALADEEKPASIVAESKLQAGKPIQNCRFIESFSGHESVRA